ncbi:alpha/beta hydrolase [Nocardia nova]|uniref:alpha/beta hydrolase n=1 Tax=Nocardia nova TaxID=37330 RepID=UPI000CE9C100|nr:alpha/beta hydrolase [Nocardia nova]
MANSTFHPELRTAARLLPRGVVPHRVALRTMRALTPLHRPRTPGVRTVRVHDRVEVRLHRPPAPEGRTPALLWMHGGGYTTGNARLDDHKCHWFATTLGITVASVGYRLAPEHPYPAALDDCHAAFDWLANLPAVDPSRIAVGGASAGGGLAAALALRLRDAGGVQPVHQLLAYPMLDDRSGYGWPAGGTDHFRLWDQRSNRFCWRAYLGDTAPDRAVPARAATLTSLPPAWIGVGSLDLFHDEDLAYAHRLIDAGVACDVDVIDGAFHGFDSISPRTVVAKDFFARQCAGARH